MGAGNVCVCVREGDGGDCCATTLSVVALFDSSTLCVRALRGVLCFFEEEFRASLLLTTPSFVLPDFFSFLSFFPSSLLPSRCFGVFGESFPLLLALGDPFGECFGDAGSRRCSGSARAIKGLASGAPSEEANGNFGGCIIEEAGKEERGDESLIRIPKNKES